MLHEHFKDPESGFTKVLAQDPDNIEAVKGRGYCLLNIDRIDAAIADLDRVLASRPDDTATLRGRSKAYTFLLGLTASSPLWCFSESERCGLPRSGGHPNESHGCLVDRDRGAMCSLLTPAWGRPRDRALLRTPTAFESRHSRALVSEAERQPAMGGRMRTAIHEQPGDFGNRGRRRGEPIGCLLPTRAALFGRHSHCCIWGRGDKDPPVDCRRASLFADL
jgi:hypothetical protein